MTIGDNKKINQLDALFYNKFISSLYMFRAHVLIVRRAKLYYTVSGIITLCSWPSRVRDGHLQRVMIPQTV